MTLQYTNLAVIEAAGMALNREPDSNATPFEWSSLFDGSENSPRHEPITQLELDTYRIALVPYGGRRHSEGTSHSAAENIRELLLLPLTWKEFLTHVRGSKSADFHKKDAHPGICRRSHRSPINGSSTRRQAGRIYRHGVQGTEVPGDESQPRDLSR